MLRYWKRISTSEKTLLQAAWKTNEDLQKRGKQNWKRVIHYLFQVTETGNTNTNDMDKKLRRLYISWWTEQAKPTGTTKLDFYFKYKKTFQYENYLDNIPHHIRTYITRLRTSSHSFPVETMRYNKKKKIPREDRKCCICNLAESGDEIHYLLKCNNAEIGALRAKFMKEIRELIPQLSSFSNENIIDYGMILHDQRIYLPLAMYVKQIMRTYTDETDGTKIKISTPVKTKSGRLIRKPQKLDL